MVKNSFWYWAAFIFLVVVGFWLLLKMVRAYRLSGFRFYLFSGFIFGLPFIFWALIFYYFPNAGIIPFFFVFIITRLGQEWGKDQEEKASQTDASRWEEYQSRVSKEGLLARIFF